MRTAFMVLALWSGCKGCEACAPDLPSDTSDSDRVDTGPVDTDTADTDAPPPCAWPESEPNGPGEPDPVVLEETACGAFGAALDFDWWRFSLDEDHWLTVRVDARSLSSRADPAVQLAHDDGDQAEARAYDDGYEDVLLRFPALAGGYTLLLTDELGAGGEEGYDYELLVGLAKAPLDWNTDEIESNDAQGSAQALAAGSHVLGFADEPGDEDWYAIDVPSGKATVQLGIGAAAEASAGDFRFDLLDASGKTVASETSGVEGWEHDPWLEYVSSGNERLFLRVREEFGRGGRAYWYVLAVELP